MGGKIIPRVRLTSVKDLVEVEAELGNIKVMTLLSVFRNISMNQPSKSLPSLYIDNESNVAVLT